jgi:hypothetical protein
VLIPVVALIAAVSQSQLGIRETRLACEVRWSNPND